MSAPFGAPLDTETPDEDLRKAHAAITGALAADLLDQIFVQAKRYGAGNNIGAGAIRDFYGALSLKKAHKGIFVTTSAFSQSAVDTARALSSRIVLIDGLQLSRLMIRYNVGCRDEDVLHLKRVDEDFSTIDVIGLVRFQTDGRRRRAQAVTLSILNPRECRPMNFRQPFVRRPVRWLVACMLSLAASCAFAQDGAAALRARYQALAEPLRQSAFGRPLLLESTDERGRLRGDIHGVMNHPYAAVMALLSEPAQWCEVLILHLNTKYCRAEDAGPRARLALAIGRKTEQAVQDAHRVEFAWHEVAATQQFLDIRLDAPDGPLGTSNYRIALEAIPIDGNRTFLHLSYAYDYGVASGIAMRAYLATAGRSKIGFSTDRRDASGAPVPVSGMRGAIERNAMRYYLAIDSRLSVPPGPGALDKRLAHWFAATEQ